MLAQVVVQEPYIAADLAYGSIRRRGKADLVLEVRDLARAQMPKKLGEPVACFSVNHILRSDAPPLTGAARTQE